jgi:hypothetical protein
MPNRADKRLERELIKTTRLISLSLESALIAVGLAILVQLAFDLGQTIHNSPAARSQETIATGYGTLPLSVEANQGQVDSRATISRLARVISFS